MESPEANPIPSSPATETPSAWALEFCKTDLEHLRQFHVRFLGMDEVQHLPLAGDRLVAQARYLTERYPDADHARAALWLGVFEGLTVEQRLYIRLLSFPEIAAISTDLTTAEFPISTAV